MLILTGHWVVHGTALAGVLLLLGYVLSVISYLRLARSLSAAYPPGTDAGRLVAYLNAWRKGHDGLVDGYAQVSKRNQAFVMPTPGLSPVVMLPKEQQKWLVSQPENVLSQRTANVESYALNHLFPSVDMHNEVLINMVKRFMVGRLGAVQADMYDELRRVTDDQLGTDTTLKWREVRVASVIKDIVLRTGYRVHVGSVLCRNEEFVAVSWRMTLWTGIGTMIVGQFSPRLWKRLFGFLCSFPIAYYIRRYRSLIYPVFRDRLGRAERGDQDLPQDAMSWTALILQDRHSKGSTLNTIIDNFITIFTAAFATIPVMIHAVLNLVSLPEDSKFLALMQAEICSVFSSPEAWIDPDTIAPGRLPLTEAFLRESMRYTPFFARGQEHKVMRKEGLVLPDGACVPYGTYLACPVAGVAADERFYNNPDQFDPFRFLVEGESDGIDRWRLQPNCQLTSPSEIFMGFGYGKHACPGRFFAARIAKLLVAYFVYHYEFVPLKVRPRNRVVGSFTMPPLFTKLRVRRRQKS